MDELKNINVPPRVREGDVLSASWLNQAADCMRALHTRMTSISSPGGGELPSTSISSSGYYKDTKARPYDDEELPIFYHRDFELRLDPATGGEDSPYMVQMRGGRVRDYRGLNLDILSPDLAGGDGSPTSGSTSEGESAGWITLGPAEGCPEVYLVVETTSLGAVKNVKITQAPEEEVPWVPIDTGGTWAWDEEETQGSGETGPGTEGVVCVHVGSVKREEVNEVVRYYIEQHHLGPVELQVVNVAKLEIPGGSQENDGSDAGSKSPDPIGLFRERKGNAFFFKPLLEGEGMNLTDGHKVSFAIKRANYTPSGSGDSGGGGSAPMDGSGSEEDSTQRLGGVDAIDYDDKVEAPCIQQGAIKLSLAHCLPSAEGSYQPEGSGDSSGNVKGGVCSISFDEVIPAPGIDKGNIKVSLAQYSQEGESRPGGVKSIDYDPDIVAPTLEKGAIKLSLADAPAGGGSDDTPTTGGVCSFDIDPNAEGPSIDKGKIKMPLCSTEDGRSGAVRSIKYDSEVPAPKISQGDIFLAVADSLSMVLGGIREVEVAYLPSRSFPIMGSVSQESLNYIEKGKLHISVPLDTEPEPIPGSGSGSGSGSGGSGGSGGGGGSTGGGSTPEPGCSCPTYEFDSAYFSVSNAGNTRRVSLNPGAISNLVQEVVGEVQVQLNVTGLSEVTEYGTIHVSTAGAGSVSALSVDSTVSY